MLVNISLKDIVIPIACLYVTKLWCFLSFCLKPQLDPSGLTKIEITMLEPFFFLMFSDVRHLTCEAFKTDLVASFHSLNYNLCSLVIKDK